MNVFKTKYNFGDSFYYINDKIRLFPYLHTNTSNFFKEAIDNIHIGIITDIIIDNKNVSYMLDSKNSFFENELFNSIKKAYNAYLVILKNEIKNCDITTKYSFEKFKKYCKVNNISFKKEKNKKEYMTIIKTDINFTDYPYYISEYLHTVDDNCIDFAIALRRCICKSQILSIRYKNDGSILYRINGCMRNEDELFIDKKDAYNKIFSFLKTNIKNYHGNTKNILANIKYFEKLMNF